MIIMVAAVDINGGLGRDNKLLWNIPEDLKRFKEITSGKNIVMGRKTLESLPRLLPNRHHIVLTKNVNYSRDGVEIFNNVEDILLKYKEEDLYIIGGSEVYSIFAALCDSIELTIVFGNYNADVFFPDITSHDWTVEFVGQHSNQCVFMRLIKDGNNINV